MSDVFIPIPTELEFLRQIPIEGAWAVICCNLPISFKSTNIEKGDIVFVYNEQMPKRDYNLFQQEKKKYGKRNYKDLLSSIRNKMIYSGDNYLVYDVVTKCNGTFRVFDCEINIDEKDKDLLSKAYDIYHFSLGNLNNINEIPPIAEQEIKDIIDALQLDGLTKVKAIKHLIDNKVLETKKEKMLLSLLDKEIKIDLPSYFYKLKSELAQILNNNEC